MKQLYLTLASLLLSCIVSAQEHGFPFGRVTYSDMDINSFPNDTTATAVVLNEFGIAYIDSETFDLNLEYHIKIKVLKQKGVEKGNVEVLLYKQKEKEEFLKDIRASSFNVEPSGIKETKLDPKDVFKQQLSQFAGLQTFAIPNVKVGSIIEYQYTVVSPFISNFHPWYFQDDIPKMNSTYWANLPAFYIYNITLRGYLKMTTNESELKRDCFSTGGGKADCVLHKFGMKDIPAFVEEEYMTAKSNYLSTINFELAEIRHFDGRIDKVAREWKDADDELKRDARFGMQIKRGQGTIDQDIAQVVAGLTDPLAKAKGIYDFIKYHFEWDEVRGKYSEFGVRKAFDRARGNVGDINLSLIAALTYAGLDVEPVILSTRANGFPMEVHPVITDFDYVIAKLVIDNKTYLLDATDDFLPFGLIPERCLNGQGRALADQGSYWVPLRAPEKKRTVSMLNLKLSSDGKLTGTIQNSYFGYAAVERRKVLAIKKSDEEYAGRIKSEINFSSIGKIEFTNHEELDKPLVEKFDVETELFGPEGAANVLFSPFFSSQWKKNPFRSSERFFPVDFGIPIDQSTIITLEFPAEYKVTSVPENVGLQLPNTGGRYLFGAQVVGNRLTISNSLSIARQIYSPEEYHALKELFSRIIQTQATDVVLQKN